MARRDEVSSTSDILLYFVALILPPVSVFVKRGCGADFWINIALSLLGWLPGLIHAWYIVSKYSTYEVRRAPAAAPAPTPAYYNHQAQQAPLPGQSAPPQPQQPYYPSEPAPPLYPAQPATKKI
ncbi:hypothetical protein OC845_005350 [Tilletia horrida]|nr:hypothetical protein OC845_005350 [Tilletia horrida]